MIFSDTVLRFKKNYYFWTGSSTLSKIAQNCPYFWTPKTSKTVQYSFVQNVQNRPTLQNGAKCYKFFMNHFFANLYAQIIIQPLINFEHFCICVILRNLEQFLFSYVLQVVWEIKIFCKSCRIITQRNYVKKNANYARTGKSAQN